MASKEIATFSHIEVFNYSEDIVDFKTLLNCVKKYSHKFLHILLLETL